MRTSQKVRALSILAIACAVLLAASDASAGPIRTRKTRQQDRIAQGVRSGQLTAGETARLERQERSLNQEERDMRRLDGGKLTLRDRQAINQQQNQLSRRIYRQKHDSQTQ
jgi:uncharacterized protein HemX